MRANNGRSIFGPPQRRLRPSRSKHRRLVSVRGARKDERKGFLELLAMTVDDAAGPGADLAIGVKGKIAFGAVATRSGSGRLKQTTGTIVDTTPLREAAAALPSP